MTQEEDDRYHAWMSRGCLYVRAIHDSEGFTLIAFSRPVPVGSVQEAAMAVRRKHLNQDDGAVYCRVLREVDEEEVKQWYALCKRNLRKPLHEGWWYEVLMD